MGLLRPAAPRFVGLLLGLMSAAIAVGCYSWTTMRTAPAGSEQAIPESATPSRLRGCVADVRSSGDTERFLMVFSEKLSASRLFSEVRDRRCDDPSSINFSILRSSRADPHIARTVLQSVSFVLYGIPTLIPYRWDYEESLSVEALRGDGQTRTYRSLASGTAYYTFWAGIGGPRQKARDEITSRVINDIVNQIARDRAFYVVPPELPRNRNSSARR